MRAIFLSILFLLLPLFYPVSYSALCKDKPQDFPDNLTGKWIRLDNMIVPHMGIRYNPEHECKDMVFKDYSGIFAGKNCYTAYKFATSSGSMEFDYVEIDKKNNQFSLRYTGTEMQPEEVVQVLKNGKYVPYDKNDTELFQASYAGKLSGYKYKLVYEKDWLERVIMRPTYIPKVDGYEIDDYQLIWYNHYYIEFITTENNTDFIAVGPYFQEYGENVENDSPTLVFIRADKLKEYGIPVYDYKSGNKSYFYYKKPY